MLYFKVLEDDHGGAQILVDGKPAFCVDDVHDLGEWGKALWLASQAGAKEENELCARVAHRQGADSTVAAIRARKP